MGGHGCSQGIYPPTEDPAIPRYDAMRENAHKGFKWTRGTVRTGIVGLVIIPVATYFAVRKFDVRVPYILDLLVGSVSSP
ncbi:hypothetical protein DL96DRAFT_1599154 [Flagelloscypha sp. PMI_526]|nr:hypothetical protein DL96DRAFT_1599154 [Flagelloscypha sp. PMI_526]